MPKAATQAAVRRRKRVRAAGARYKRVPKRIRQYVKKTVRNQGETSIHNGVLNVNVTDAGTVQGPFDNISDTHRSGARILPSWFRYSMSMANDDSTNILRIIWFRWQVNTADDLPDPAAILYEFATHAYPWFSIHHPPGSSDRKRYHVLSDKIYNLSTERTPQIVVRGRVKVPKQLLYNGSAVTTGKNQLYCLMISDSNVSGPQVIMRYDFAFKDDIGAG